MAKSTMNMEKIMDINSVNSSNSIQNLNNGSHLNVNKSQLKYSIGDFQNEHISNINVSQSSILKSEFSQDIQSINDGIAKSKIAQVSMDKLQDFLKNVQNKLENSQNYEDKNELKQSINQDLKEFNIQAFETKYKDEALIANKYNDEQESIQVSSNNSLFSIDKPNVANFTNNIFNAVNNSDLNNPKSVDYALSVVSNSSNQLQELSNQFSNFSKQLENEAKNQISEQGFNKSIDFGQESSDFTKSNIVMNSGYLAAAQANIIQEQSVRLLS